MEPSHQETAMSDSQAFADEWCAAWNAHDLERLLTHFSDDVVFKSPAARKLLPGSDGTVVSKAALRAYWSEGLRLIPNLQFRVRGVFEGVDCLTINFVNQDGRAANEVLIFRDGQIVEGFGTYLIEAKSTLGTSQDSVEP
jgi:ketosteroid isomerase-like protein